MIDFDGTLNAAISSTLGDEKTVIYTPAGGTPVPILAVFTLITNRVFGEGDMPDANIAVATLGFQSSQLPVESHQGDGVLVAGLSYVVKDAAIDGLGWVYADLGAL